MNYYDILLAQKLNGGGGSSVEVEPLSVTENGTYTAEQSKAFSPVTVSVPQGVFPSGTYSITENGVYDITDFASASVSVSQGVFPSGTYSITQNGIYDVTNFASASVNVSGGGEDLLAKNLDGTLSGAYTYSGTYLKSYAFCDCSLLTSINCPVCTSIGGSAFSHCKSLTSVSFPVCTSIGASAFFYCSSLTSVSFPACTRISSFAFLLCYSLTTANFPACTSIGGSAFESCSSLTSVNFPECKTIATYAFAYCYPLMSAVSFPVCTSIAGNAFVGCKSLTSFYLTGSSIPTLSSTTAFNNTPMSDSSYLGYYGSIFVPASLVDSYKSATNWRAYSDRITAYTG